NDEMWSELFVANKDVLLEQMDLFIGKFGELREMLKKEDVDGMRRMMRHSTARRSLFDKK
ncbi:MAG: prephenate dehydrogenase/arogenate dehydrogenase family protein, partial [Clostridia bacterium]|nr:prephenate dehydrogenase/arogenate dehydrogenase family protein [Clostridia bacterium]